MNRQITALLVAVKAGLFAEIGDVVAGKIKDRLLIDHLHPAGQAGHPAPGDTVIVGAEDKAVPALEIEGQFVVAVADAGALLPDDRLQHLVDADAPALLQARAVPEMALPVEKQRDLGGTDDLLTAPGDRVADVIGDINADGDIFVGGIQHQHPRRGDPGQKQQDRHGIPGLLHTIPSFHGVEGIIVRAAARAAGRYGSAAPG